MFEFDVFISHSSKDKPAVMRIAEQLRSDGLKVWLDAWQIKPGDHIPVKIEHGLEQSRVLVLCMSAQVFGSDWAQMESHTFRFRDPINRDRRFIPLRLDDTPVRDGLAPFAYVDWRQPMRENAYKALLEACRPPASEEAGPNPKNFHVGPNNDMSDLNLTVLIGKFNSDRTIALTGGGDGSVTIWNVRMGKMAHTFGYHKGIVWAVAWSPDEQFVVSGGFDDHRIFVWNVETGECVRELIGHTDHITCLTWSIDPTQIISGSDDGTIRFWNASTGACTRILTADPSGVWGLAMSADQRRLLSGSRNRTVSLWDAETGKLQRVLEGHTGELRTIIWSPDQRHALSGGEDGTLRLWDLESGQCIHAMEGHTDYVWTLSWHEDHNIIISSSTDFTVRLWNPATGKCIGIFSENQPDARLIAWNGNQGHVLSGDSEGNFRAWDFSNLISSSAPPTEIPKPSPSIAQSHYTNAKVLLVGESSAGKTGLSMVLANQPWRPSDSTVGAWATQWKLSEHETGEAEREIWLWDFGGQADQRLIHQLYFDETSAAVLVFDGQKDDIFETIGQWNRDLSRADDKPFAKLLVAGRIDAGGLRISHQRMESYAQERGFSTFLETSAKTGSGCAELRQAIIDAIDWDAIPWRSSPLLFKRLKEEIISIKDSGTVLMRYNELRETLRLKLTNDTIQFQDADLKAVVGLLGGPGVIWELSFGSWILLQPEYINAYAQALVRTLREDKFERGCISESRVLKGDLSYDSFVQRLPAEEERIILLAMHQTLVERGLCLREQTDKGPLLVFPSYHRRERPELTGHPAVLVSYQFAGFLDDIYSTLVVRLHHTSSFNQDQLWRYAADFRTLTGKKLGIKLIRRAEGAGELDVYFDPVIPKEEKIIFSKYIHEHLLQNAQNVIRLRHYVCPHCGTPVGNRDIAMKRLMEGRQDMACASCDVADKRVPLWDELEELFASSDLKKIVKDLQIEVSRQMDNESKERVLVGEVISTVAIAGQISREFPVSDHGIDMEIEFKSDTGEATGRKVYLQLKSGESHIFKRKRDNAEIFKIQKARHAEYWRDQSFPVLLLIRSSSGEIRWMEIRDHLREISNDDRVPSSIIFTGQRFDVMSVRRWRDEALARMP